MDFPRFIRKKLTRLAWALGITPREPRFSPGQGAPVSRPLQYIDPVVRPGDLPAARKPEVPRDDEHLAELLRLSLESPLKPLRWEPVFKERPAPAIVDSDFADAELRILRHWSLANAAEGTPIFAHGDVWTQVAARLYGIDPSKVTKLKRRITKAQALAVMNSDRPPFVRPATPAQLAQYIANRIQGKKP